jgi:hypothetical protein
MRHACGSIRAKPDPPHGVNDVATLPKEKRIFCSKLTALLNLPRGARGVAMSAIDPKRTWVSALHMSALGVKRTWLFAVRTVTRSP